MFGIPELQELQARRQMMMGDVLGRQRPLRRWRGTNSSSSRGSRRRASCAIRSDGSTSQAAYWTRELFRTQARALKNEPELMARQDILKMLETHERNMLGPRSGGDAAR